MKFESVGKIADKIFRDMLNMDPKKLTVEGSPERKAGEYRFPIPEIDGCVGALKAGEMYTIAARPGIGKTTLLVNTALCNALEGRAVYFISLETRPNRLVENMIPIVTGLDIGKLDDAAYNDEHRKILCDAWSMIRNLPIFFYEDPEPGEDFTSTRIIEAAVKENIRGELILVDYIQLLTPEGVYNSPLERDAAAAKELEQIAEKCNSPLIVTSQLNRGVEARADKMPRISDINEGMRSCSAASMVLFRKNYYDKNAESEFITVIWSKNADEEHTVSYNPFFDTRSLHTDRLSFKLSDPKELGEEWALKLQESPTVAEVYINGKELISIVREREREIRDVDDLCEPGSYGHLSVDELYRELHEAQTGQYEYAHLLCCNNCGDCFCWSVQAKISVGLKYVTWTLSHNHRDWEYNLKYRFDKTEYMGLLRILEIDAKGRDKL